jgi:hypothetical protein
MATTFNKIIDNVTLELFPLHPEGRWSHEGEAENCGILM